MAAVDASDVEPFLKKTYIPKAIEFMGFSEFPLMTMMQKDEEMGAGGTNGTHDLTVGTEYPQGATSSFANAQTNAATAFARGARFNLTPTRLYQIAQVDNLLLRALEGNKHAYLSRIQMEVDGHIMGLKRTLATAMYRKGWGRLGTTATAAAAQDTLTLENIEDAVNFAEGQVIVASSVEELATLRSAGASIIVESVNYATGVITFTTNINDIAALAVGDSLFIKGTRENSATPTRLLPAGVLDWVPITAPTGGESFFGKDRSGNSRLFGPAVDCSGLGMMEAITKGYASVRRFGGRPTHLFLNTKNFADLQLEVQTKGNFSMIDVKAGSEGALTIPAMKVFTPNGQLTVVDDPLCPVNRMPLLKLDTWRLGSVGGPAIGLLEHGGKGNKSIAVYNEDALEVRLGGYPQMWTTHPGWNAVLNLV